MKFIYSILLTALFFASSINVNSKIDNNVNNFSDSVHSYRQVKDSSSESNVDTVIYRGDYNNLNLGLNNDQLYSQTIIASQQSNVTLATVTHNESTMIQATINNSGQNLFIGTGQNQGKGGFDLVDGVSYRVKMYLELNLSEGGSLYIAPWLREWTAIYVSANGVVDATNKGLNQNPNVKNASYVDNILQFDYCYLANENSDKYILVEAASCNAGDTYYIGSLEITKLDTYLLSQDFSLLVSDSNVTGYNSLFWVDGFESSTIIDNGTSKVANFKNSAVNPNTYPSFYFHHLSTNYGYDNTSLVDGRSYTFTIEFSKWQTTNMWIFFVEGNGNSLNYEYGNFSVCAGWEFFFSDYSFVDNVLRFTVHPDSTIKNIGTDLMVKFMFNSGDKALDIEAKSIVIEDEEMINAKLYAKEFLSVTSVCDPSGNTNNITNEMWTELKTKYEALTTYSKDNIKNETADENGFSVINRALSRYEYIASKYGYEDFIDRNVQATKFNIVFFENSSSNLFYAITILGVLSTAVLLVLLIKRKKSQI